MIFYRAEDASISSPYEAFISEGMTDFKPYSPQCRNMMRNMGYNLKRPTG